MVDTRKSSRFRIEFQKGESGNPHKGKVVFGVQLFGGADVTAEMVQGLIDDLFFSGTVEDDITGFCIYRFDEFGMHFGWEKFRNSPREPLGCHPCPCDSFEAEDADKIGASVDFTAAEFYMSGHDKTLDDPFLKWGKFGAACEGIDSCKREVEAQVGSVRAVFFHGGAVTHVPGGQIHVVIQEPFA